MANLVERPEWPDYIYRLQAHTDPVSGGSEGVHNRQPSQVANRTRWLLTMLSREHSITRNTHLVSAEQVAEDAAIDEEKVVLDATFGELREALAEAAANIALAEEKGAEFAGSDGYRLEALMQAQIRLWKTGAHQHAWEFFRGALTISGAAKPTPIFSTVRGDDTILIHDVSGISVGQALLAWSGDGTDTEAFVVKEILHDTSIDEYRILADHALEHTRDGGYVGATSWDVKDGYAIAKPGSIYMAAGVTTLSEACSGLLVMHADQELSVYVRMSGEDTWQNIAVSDIVSGEDGVDYLYKLPSGVFDLRIVNNSGEDAEVGYLGIIPDRPALRPDPIRKPKMYLPAAGTVYRDDLAPVADLPRVAYGDNITGVDFWFHSDNADKVYHSQGAPFYQVLFTAPAAALSEIQQDINDGHGSWSSTDAHIYVILTDGTVAAGVSDSTTDAIQNKVRGFAGDDPALVILAQAPGDRFVVILGAWAYGQVLTIGTIQSEGGSIDSCTARFQYRFCATASIESSTLSLLDMRITSADSYGKTLSPEDIPVDAEDTSRLWPDLSEGQWEIRCRYVSDVGDESDWSDPVAIRLVDPVRYFSMYTTTDEDHDNAHYGPFGSTEDDSEGDIRDAERSGAMYSLKDATIGRFGFAGGTDTYGFDNGTFIVPGMENDNEH